jgi:hypothetical protein
MDNIGLPEILYFLYQKIVPLSAFGIFAIALWLYLRHRRAAARQQSPTSCRECGKYYEGKPSFCPHCGKPVLPST